MSAVGALGEAETVAAHDDAILQRHAVSDLTILADHGVGMRVKIVANPGSRVNHHVRMQHRVAADHSAVPHHGKRSNGGVVADAGRGRDRCRRMNPRRRPGRLVKQGERPREIQIRVARKQLRGAQILDDSRNQNSPGARVLHLVRVFRIR